MMNPYLIAEALVSEMGADNGCTFAPTNEQWQLLRHAVMRMQADGCEFSNTDIEEMVAGEDVEREEQFKRFQSWGTLDLALNDIFDGRVL